VFVNGPAHQDVPRVGPLEPGPAPWTDRLGGGRSDQPAAPFLFGTDDDGLPPLLQAGP